MAIIFPGNYVERLNAYSQAKTIDGTTTTPAQNRQGVEALPGLNYYSAVGVVIVPAAGLAAGNHACMVLSPDMRADDKPRLDVALQIPVGAKVYRIALRGINIKGAAASGELITVTKSSAGGAFSEADLKPELATVAVNAAGNYLYTPDNDNSEFKGLAATATEAVTGNEIAIHATTAAAVNVLDTDDVSAILIEICYFMDAAAPVTDDVNLPFKTEAGSS